MSSIEVSVELLTLLVGGSGAVLACLDAGLDTRRRDVLDGKKSSLMSPAWHDTRLRGCVEGERDFLARDTKQ
jgi:hypothetical protein